MKILVIQLARFGDLYQTVPCLRSLRRTHPEAQIHLLVRERFATATCGIDFVDKVLTLNSSDILEPIIIGQSNIDASLDKVGEVCEAFKKDSYTNIINLSFSPLSSYLVHSIQGPNTQVMGYNRYDDGYLAIPDDASAYFYAQVGIGRFNRVHLTDIFASIIGLDLKEEDICPPEQFISNSYKLDLKKRLNLSSHPYLVMHVGASQAHKSLPPFKWRQVLEGIRKSWAGDIYLIGALNEREIVDKILLGQDMPGVVDLVGKTLLEDIFPIIDEAQILVGCDSVAVHVASMTNTPTLNISFSSVNFWETGPRAESSRVVWADNAEALPSDRITQELEAMINNRRSGLPTIHRRSELLSAFEFDGIEDDHFSWDLIKAIYMDGDFPIPKNIMIFEGMKRLDEVANLALHQLELMKDPEKCEEANLIFDQVDGIIKSIDSLVPALQPLVAWFQTERVRIGPGTFEQVIAENEEQFKKLKSVLSIYAVDEDQKDQLSDNKLAEV